MSQPNLALTRSATDPPADPAADLSTDLAADPAAEVRDDAAWKDVLHLLRRAAKLAAERNTDSDLFMEAAWTACLDARPGLREALEDKELRSQLKKLRKRGLVGKA